MCRGCGLLCLSNEYLQWQSSLYVVLIIIIVIKETAMMAIGEPILTAPLDYCIASIVPTLFFIYFIDLTFIKQMDTMPI
jgi:hypothetical protein